MRDYITYSLNELGFHLNEWSVFITAPRRLEQEHFLYLET